MEAEGWYVDPFGAHEHRWFSRGLPTDLVRDAGETSTDIPPAPTWDPPTPLREADDENDGVDLRRADDGAGGPPDPPDRRSVLRTVIDAVTDVLPF